MLVQGHQTVQGDLLVLNQALTGVNTAPLHQLKLLRTLHLTWNLPSNQLGHCLLVIHTALLQPDNVFPIGNFLPNPPLTAVI